MLLSRALVARGVRDDAIPRPSAGCSMKKGKTTVPNLVVFVAALILPGHLPTIQPDLAWQLLTVCVAMVVSLGVNAFLRL
jgi:hypothetical protein